jgi:hypothetical protein
VEQRTALELREAANQVDMNLETRKIELDRIRQEIRNLTNDRDLYSRLIAELPQIASNMPDVQELRVLQTNTGDGAFDTLSGFIARMLALAESFGIRPTVASNGEGKTDGKGD